jgi:TonB family protein
MNKDFKIDWNSFQEILASAFLVQQSKLDKTFVNTVAEIEQLMERDHFSVDTIAEIPVEESPEALLGEEPPGSASQYQSTPTEEFETPPSVDPVPNEHAPIASVDPWTLPLSVLVILLVLILGWMLGRVTWRRTQTTPTPAIPTASQDRLDSKEGNSQNDVSPPPQPVPKKKNIPIISDSLVVYQDGKVIFRTDGASGSRRPESGDGKAESSSTELPMARVAHKVTPEYPELAKQRHIEGPVVLEALVGANGEVQQLDVISGAPILACAASDAVRKWRFTLPGTRSSGTSVLRITVNFRLR